MTFRQSLFAGVALALLSAGAAHAQLSPGTAAALPTPLPTTLSPVTGTQTAVTTSASANTFTILAAAATGNSRKGLLYQNKGGNTQYIFVGTGTATITNALVIPPGGTYNANYFGVIEQGQIQIASSVVSDTGVLLVQ